MLFRLMNPSCSYCRFGTPIGDGEVACTKRGITSEGGYCRKFRYDPLKRNPERPAPLRRISLEAEAPAPELPPSAEDPDELTRAQAEIERLRETLFPPAAPSPAEIRQPSMSEEDLEALKIVESAAALRAAQAKELEAKVSAELAREFAPGTEAAADEEAPAEPAENAPGTAETACGTAEGAEEESASAEGADKDTALVEGAEEDTMQESEPG